MRRRLLRKREDGRVERLEIGGGYIRDGALSREAIICACVRLRQLFGARLARGLIPRLAYALILSVLGEIDSLSSVSVGRLANVRGTSGQILTVRTRAVDALRRVSGHPSRAPYD